MLFLCFSSPWTGHTVAVAEDGAANYSRDARWRWTLWDGACSDVGSRSSWSNRERDSCCTHHTFCSSTSNQSTLDQDQSWCVVSPEERYQTNSIGASARCLQTMASFSARAEGASREACKISTENAGSWSHAIRVTGSLLHTGRDSACFWRMGWLAVGGGTIWRSYVGWRLWRHRKQTETMCPCVASFCLPVRASQFFPFFLHICDSPVRITNTAPRGSRSLRCEA